MALTSKEASSLVAGCRRLKDGPDYRVNNYISNVMNTVLDFQMDSKVVGASSEHFRQYHHVNSHRKLAAIVASFPNRKAGNLRLAQHLWGYNHWTRAKFLREILKQFDARGIRGQASLKRWVESAEFVQDVKGQFKTKEHSIGYALFHWLQLRLGVDTVKPDVHIINFVSESVGRRVSAKEAVDGLLSASKTLKRKAYRLDAAIWHYQRGESA